MMKIGREFLFDCAHKLVNYHGKCENVHGHTYKLQVIIQGVPGSNGMVMDFALLEKIVNDKVLSIIDHSYLNDIIPQPTAENVALFIWKKLIDDLPSLFEIKLWENPSNWVVVRAGDVAE
ncbi:MAG: 6-carboxytetrahydropterin synthase QueD [Candidatus Eremiobacteraeota bacterium]|nr:6-carboxytetrahydropterin synthase QueD [Candidatus Eremiobacteraeota bacterium]